MLSRQKITAIAYSYALLYAMAVIFCRDSMSAQTIICNEVHE